MTLFTLVDDGFFTHAFFASFTSALKLSQPVARRLSNKRVKNLRFVELQAVFAEGIDLILLLLYLGQERADIVPTRREGYIFKFLLFFKIVNDKMRLYSGHRDL